MTEVLVIGGGVAGNWLRHILLRQGRDGPDIREEPVHTEGLELPAREDFFATTY